MALPPDDPPPGVPEWVVTYGDMMSLLLTFFIMLVSMSEIKSEGKLRRMMDSLKQRFGPSEGFYGTPGPVFSDSSDNQFASSSGISSEGGVKRTGMESGGLAGPSRTVQRIGTGTQITLGGLAAFGRFDSELTNTAKEDLEVIAKVIGPRPNKIVVRGHATREPLPPGGKYRDAVDLSFARALAGAEYLIGLGIDRKRISVTAAGDAEPRVISRDPEGQSQNRRIDVFVIDEYTSPGSSAKSDGRTPHALRTRSAEPTAIR